MIFFNDLIKINKDEDILSCHLCITLPLPFLELYTLSFYMTIKAIKLIVTLSFRVCKFKFVIIIQLSPEGEVNSGGYIPRREASRYISTALHRP